MDFLDRIPYTYLVKCIPTNQCYYGSRTAKGCDPSELWIRYFTSSKVIQRLIVEYGVESFQYSIRKIFKSKLLAVKWEMTVLRRLKTAQSDKWINLHNGGNKFIHILHSQKTRDKISRIVKNRSRDIVNKTANTLKRKHASGELVSVFKTNNPQHTISGKQKQKAVFNKIKHHYLKQKLVYIIHYGLVRLGDSTDLELRYRIFVEKCL